MVCASSWVCPVCAGKISERRRVELSSAVQQHTGRGGRVLLLTLTVPHHAGQASYDLVDKLTRLSRSFWSGRSRASLDLAGYVGQVRALEVTFGPNGPHPHLHTLLFVGADCDPEGVREALWGRWRGLVASAGLGEASPAAFSLQDGSAAGEYAAKWGVVEELTKANVKVARHQAGRSPFALLADYLEGDERAGRLFVEYAAAFKGKSQLHWSPGLRGLLQLGQDLTDEELAGKVDALDELAMRLTDAELRVICRHGLHGAVLEVLRDGTAEGVREMLRSFATPRTFTDRRPPGRRRSSSTRCAAPVPSSEVSFEAEIVV